MKFGGLRTLDARLGLGTLGFVVASAIVALLRPFGPPGPPRTDLNLRATEHEGRMRVDWDTRAQAVRSAHKGVLKVVDGGQQNVYPMEPRVVRSGSFDYLRQGDDVVLTMTLFSGDKPTTEASIHNVAPVQLSIPAIEPRKPAIAPSKTSTRSKARSSRTRRGR